MDTTYFLSTVAAGSVMMACALLLLKKATSGISNLRPHIKEARRKQKIALDPFHS
jgi:hypothetical protein